MACLRISWIRKGKTKLTPLLSRMLQVSFCDCFCSDDNDELGEKKETLKASGRLFWGLPLFNNNLNVCVCVCMCTSERERESES